MQDPVLRRVRQCLTRLGALPNRATKHTREIRLALRITKTMRTSWIICGFGSPAKESSEQVRHLTKIFLQAKDRPHETIRDLKGSYHNARLQSLTGRDIGNNTRGKVYPRSVNITREKLYQISCASRALPEPWDESPQVQESLKTFKSTVLVKPKFQPSEGRWFNKTTDNLLNSVRSRKIIRKFRKNYKDEPSRWSPLGESACAGYSRKDGGRSKHFQMNTYFSNEFGTGAEMLATFNNFSTIVDPDIGKTMFGMMIEDSYMFSAPDLQDSTESEVSVVAEKGYKARIVTKNDPFKVARAHAIRKVLFPLVVDNSTTAVADPPKFVKVSSSSQGRWVFSFDISAATDNLLFEALEKICNKLGIRTELVFDGFTIDGQKVYRGAFMGMPVSWTILEWTHNITCLSVDPDGHFVTRGDDGMAYWTDKMFAIYERRMCAWGYKINRKKTFRSPDMGTFCEALYRLVGDKLVMQSAISIRSLVFADRTLVYDSIANASRLALERGFDMSKFYRAAELLYAKELSFARKARVPYFLPQTLGGLGFAPVNPKSKISKYEAWIWQTLSDTDFPQTPKVKVPLGPHVKRVLKNSNKVSYRTGAKNSTCVHWDDVFSHNLMLASVFDADAKHRVSPFSYKLFIRGQTRILRRVPKKIGSVRTIPTGGAMLSLKVYPTKESIQSIYAHECNGEETTIIDETTM